MQNKFNMESNNPDNPFCNLPCIEGCGERGDKVYKVGILSEVEAFTIIADGFKSKMAELGYIEGKNIVYDIRIANMNPEQEKEVARNFVRDNVDLIFTFPTEASIAAKEAARDTDIPVVFANANIEGTGLIESIREPAAILQVSGFQGQIMTSCASVFSQSLCQMQNAS
jgi:putative ABC transport system substrate-binding protein